MGRLKIVIALVTFFACPIRFDLSNVACSQIAWAQEEKKGEEKVLKLEEIAVRGEVIPLETAPSSATIITSEQIEDGGDYITPLDILKKVPGINVGQYGQGGTASVFQLRGFGSCSHGPDAAIYVDGIPLNETDGYADTNIIIPEEIERIEVIKGPSSALYGNYASAGVVHFITKKRGDFTKARAKYGHFNTTDVAFSMARDSEKFSQIYNIMYYYTDGYRDNSIWKKQIANGRWTYRFTDQFDGALSLRGFNSEWDAPGYLLREYLLAGRRKETIAPNDGGSKKRFDGRIELNYQLTTHSKLLYYLWGYISDFQRYYQGYIPPGTPEGTTLGNERFYEREVYGTGINYNFIGEVAGLKNNFIMGVDLLDERAHRRRWRLKTGYGRTRQDQYQDYDLRLMTISPYFQGDTRLIDPLKITWGLRYDMFTGDTDDHLTGDTYDLGVSDMDKLSPKVGLLLTIRPGYDLFANYGKGFALPRDTDLFMLETLEPASRRQYELGAKLYPLENLRSVITLYLLDTKNDIVTDPTDPTQKINAGNTRRRGAEFSLEYEITHDFFVYGDYSFLEAKYREYQTGADDYSRKYIPTAPKHIINTRIGYMPESGFGGWLEYRHVADQYLNDSNTVRGCGYDILNAQISYRWSKYALLLDLSNLTDNEYSEWASETMWAVSNPFCSYLTFKVNF